ncbi:MAG TPA: helix-turn-helix transcriptional regulator [Ktedonosporobacter sp.]|nr:helix-turn-helix transcriptional regulator [Ktedonosporobacter sp.]
MDERKSLAAARIQRHWTLEVAAERLGVGVNTLCRWEKGKVVPQAYHILKLEEVYGIPATELGLIATTVNDAVGRAETTTSAASETDEPVATQTDALQEIRIFIKSDVTQSLMTLAFLPHRHYRTIAGQMAHILEEFDIMNKENEGYAVTRREALARLATLPALTMGLTASGGKPYTMKNEDILTQCSASIAACGNLSKGTHDDMNLAFSALSNYLPTLKKVVKESTTYRKDAASLVAQASLMKAMMSVHRAGEGPRRATKYAQDAITYSEESGDLAIKLTALRRLSWIYSCDKNWQQAADSASQAQYLLEHTEMLIPSLIQNAVYYGAAKYLAQNGQTDNVLSIRDLAHKKPHSGDSELSWWADEGKFTFIKDDGLTYYHLGQYDEAFNAFTQAVDPETLETKLPASSERVRVETINYMTLTTLKNPKKDMELSIRLWKAGIQGASALQSEPRLSEAYTAYDIMEALWPHERRVKDLRVLMRQREGSDA